MQTTQDTQRPQVKFHTGWSLRMRRAAFALRAVKYLRRNAQAFAAPNLVPLEKVAEFDGRYFIAPILPHYPSAAFDHMVACGGANLSAAGTPLKRHISLALLGITRRCALHCDHCYERHNTGAQDVVPLEAWKDAIRGLQERGVGVIALSGGEPMLRYAGVLELLHTGNPDLSDFHLHTSGHGVTPDRARALRRAGLVAAAVGLDDHDPERHDRLRGFPGAFRQATAALQMFQDAGIFTYTNMCATREMIRSGGLWRYLEMARELGIGFIEMLEPRPCGGYAGRSADILLSDEDRATATAFFLEANGARRYRNHPRVYYTAYMEAPERYGCGMGGLTHLLVDSKGNVNPCPFMPVTFGNITTEPVGVILDRMRAAVPRPVHKPCPGVTMAVTLQRKVAAGAPWPVPYPVVQAEWDDLVRH